MIRYYIDCEFVEDGKTIDLISIGIVSSDGREFYGINRDCDLTKANDWVKTNVIPQLPLQPEWYEERGVEPPEESFRWMNRETIKRMIRLMVDENPEFWGEWCSYDWVCFCQIFGSMMDLPDGFPMRCRDVIQMAEDHLGIPYSKLPPSLETDGNHNALLGARTVKARYDWLQEKQSKIKLELEQEDDGRWLAEVLDLPGVLAYGQTSDGAIAKAQALALRVLAEKLEHGETVSYFTSSGGVQMIGFAITPKNKQNG